LDGRCSERRRCAKIYCPVKRVDLYAGVALSNVCGGLANGYIAARNIDPTVGLRIKF
jgi:hypothetical protein